MEHPRRERHSARKRVVESASDKRPQADVIPFPSCGLHTVESSQCFAQLRRSIAQSHPSSSSSFPAYGLAASFVWQDTPNRMAGGFHEA